MPKRPLAIAAPPPFGLAHCPHYWRDPAWKKVCKVCGEPPDYCVEARAYLAVNSGRMAEVVDVVPFCARHVPLEFEGQRGWAISRARREREYHEAIEGCARAGRAADQDLPGPGISVKPLA